jgi:acyl carrier protein
VEAEVSRAAALNTETEVLEKLRAFVVSEFLRDIGMKTVDPLDDLLSSGILDSMGVMETVAFVEDELGVRVDDEDIVPENFRTLRSLTELVLSKRQGALD